MDSDRYRKAVVSMVVSALSFSLMGLCVKEVGSRIPAAEVVLARSILSIGLSWWLLKRAQVEPWGQRKGLLIWRGAVGSGALLCVYSAIAALPLASATVLQYLYPTFTALLARIGLGERLNPRIWLGMAVGWLGVVLVAQPPALGGGSGSLPMGAVAIAIAGALLTSMAYVSVRSLASSEHPLVVVFYFPLVAFPLSLPLVVLDPVMPHGIEWVWLVGVGVFTQVGQVYLTRGLMALPAARATAISYVQVVFAGVWGWLIFGESTNGWTVAGACLVLVATVLSLARPTPAGDR